MPVMKVGRILVPTSGWRTAFPVGGQLVLLVAVWRL